MITQPYINFAFIFKTFAQLCSTTHIFSTHHFYSTDTYIYYHLFEKRKYLKEIVETYDVRERVIYIDSKLKQLVTLAQTWCSILKMVPICSRQVHLAGNNCNRCNCLGIVQFILKKNAIASKLAELGQNRCMQLEIIIVE